MDGLPVVRQAEWLHAQICTQLKQMLAPGFFPLCILRPARWVDAQLSSDPLQQGHWHGGIGQQALTGEAQQAQLRGDAQPIGVAAPLANQRQVGFTEGIVPDEFIFGVGWQ